MNILSIKNLTIAYDNDPVLKGIYLEIIPNSVTAIIGPNGAGKSTLLKSILGFLKPISGEVTLWGASIEKNLKKIAYVPQRSTVNWDFPITVFEVVLMGRFSNKKFWKKTEYQDKEMALLALEEMDLLELKDRQISQLSGGQKQRVFIARALCQDTEILLMDEPLAGVDKVSEKIIMKKMKMLQSKGKTIICVHHELATVPEYFDHVVFVNKQIIAEGSVEDAFTKENIQKTYHEVFYV